MFGGSSYIHKDGMSAPDPQNAKVTLKFVGTWSDHDPSWEEVRWQYYLDTGRVSLSTGDWASSPSQDEELTSSSTCSQCAARLTASGKRDDESQGHGATTDSVGTETRSVSPRRRFENERGMGKSRSRRSKTDRRFRRLEKTVESLSHGLILALTQLKSGDMHADTEQYRRRSGPGPRRPGHSDIANNGIESVSTDHSVDDDDDLSTVFARLGFTENSRGGIGTEAPSSRQQDNKSQSSLEENLLRMLRRLPQTTTTTPPVASRPGPENAFSCIATGNDGTLFTTGKDRSLALQTLSPILKFITHSEVFRFLKRAEIHTGLLNTQLFDLFWILDNLFNVHGGILICCLLKGLNTMDGISRSLGLDEWSRDPEFLRKLDDAYRKDLRLYIQTDGSHNASASAAWKSYCFDLAQIFSERFSSRRSVGYFRELSESYTRFFEPVITASYIEDLVKQWTAVRHALLEVTRWFEPLIDYGPDCNRSTPFYDATIVLARRAREVLSRKGVKEPEVSRRAYRLIQRLRELRSDHLTNMQLEMIRVTDNVSRDFDAAAGADDGDGDGNTSSDSGSSSGSGQSSATEEEAALLERVKRVTGGWPVITATESLGDQPAGEAGCGSSDRLRDALALHEVRVMKSYRPRLLHEGVSAAAIRSEIVRVLSGERNSRGCDITAEDIFWDGIV